MKPAHQSSPIHFVSPFTSLAYSSGSKPVALSPNGLGRRLEGGFLLATPDERQPYAGRHQLGPDRQGGEKAIERDNVHAVLGRGVRHKKGIQLTNLFIGEGCIWNHIHRSCRTPVLRDLVPLTLQGRESA